MLHLKLDIRKFNNNPNLSLFYYKYAPNFLTDYNLQNVFKSTKQEFLFKIAEKMPQNKITNERVETLKRYASGFVLMENISRFLCGTGYTSTIEWGLNFDWTSGMPYIPGSSFKGALISYLEFLKGKEVENWDSNPVELENKDTWSKEDIFHIFGPQGKEIKKHDTGAVIFFDIYPLHFSGLDIDVITPHYKKYYEKDHKNPKPDDTENPVPISFLVIKPGSKFLFAYKIKNFSDSNAHKLPELNQRLKILIEEVGRNYGFGAKTSSGYGFFKKLMNIE